MINMEVKESYRATIGGLHVITVYTGIGEVFTSIDSVKAKNLSEEDAQWLLENTDAKVTKVRVTVEEIEIKEMIVDEK
jgi:hypothetical protein